jgi:hypothetical protein
MGPVSQVLAWGRLPGLWTSFGMEDRQNDNFRSCDAVHHTVGKSGNRPAPDFEIDYLHRLRIFGNVDERVADGFHKAVTQPRTRLIVVASF